MAGRGERFSVPVSGKLVYYGIWGHDPSKYANFRVMFETAREQLTEFEATKARITADENLSDKGKAEALGHAVREFETLRQRFLGGPVADRRPQVEEQLRALRGGKARDKDDVAGVMLDMEARRWYSTLSGDELAKVNFELTQGQHPEIAGAILRAPDRMTGIRPDLREQLEQVSVDPSNAEAVQELRTELSAIEQAEAAIEKTRAEILRMAGDNEEAHKVQAAAALEDEGLQKVEGKDLVEPFEEPEVEPLPVDPDGVVDVKVRPADPKPKSDPKSDAA